MEKDKGKNTRTQEREKARKDMTNERERGIKREREKERGCYLMSLAAMHYMLTLVGQPAQK